VAASRPLIVVLAGPNGAGKSTAAPSLLRDALAVEEFVNADTIARGLSEFRPEQAAVAAGRIMLARLDTLAHQRASFAFETTLASRTFAPWLRARQSAGYHVHIAFLSLPDAETALARVHDRARLGGHNVPEDAIRRRYANGLRNFFGLYHDLPDSWRLWDGNAPGGPRLIASKQADDTDIVIIDEGRWLSLMEQAR
jgi:predicted ABC-type ATPase